MVWKLIPKEQVVKPIVHESCSLIEDQGRLYPDEKVARIFGISAQRFLAKNGIGAWWAENPERKSIAVICQTEVVDRVLELLNPKEGTPIQDWGLPKE